MKTVALVVGILIVALGMYFSGSNMSQEADRKINNMEVVGPGHTSTNVDLKNEGLKEKETASVLLSLVLPVILLAVITILLRIGYSVYLFVNKVNA